MRCKRSPREIAVAPSASCRTGRAIRPATSAAASPPKTSVATVSPNNSTRVRRISASMRRFESPTRTVPHRWRSVMMGTAKS